MHSWWLYDVSWGGRLLPIPKGISQERDNTHPLNYQCVLDTDYFSIGILSDPHRGIIAGDVDAHHPHGPSIQLCQSQSQ